MNSIKELILKIKERPSAYLGKKSVSCLKAFLDGWYLRDMTGVEDMHLMHYIQEAVEDYYNMKDTHSWDRILLFYSEDEADALAKFFILFDKIINEDKPN
ncbi:hypothetical protein Q0590_31445 [Rhodocytophaga aerolata]|uniref:Uncharacterized protein n=1 Tax=Rhodocytophaga aerolata TaxID=455078 RepID=A0ABT8RFD9_9BACT|nr:hypothetical protein [Rhodocytophaga aerolata]MDO1450831.1 hypothetical protein [Rhodocytophaga aerolata]